MEHEHYTTLSSEVQTAAASLGLVQQSLFAAQSTAGDVLCSGEMEMEEIGDPLLLKVDAVPRRVMNTSHTAAIRFDHRPGSAGARLASAGVVAYSVPLHTTLSCAQYPGTSRA
jgi:hypothetical protein